MTSRSNTQRAWKPAGWLARTAFVVPLWFVALLPSTLPAQNRSTASAPLLLPEETGQLPPSLRIVRLPPISPADELPGASFERSPIGPEPVAADVQPTAYQTPAGAAAPGAGPAAQIPQPIVPLPPGVPSPTQPLPPPAEEGWNIERVTQMAQMYNPVLRQAVAQIDSARGDALQAGIYPNPRFDTNNPEVFAGSASNFNVGFMQDIVVKGKLRLDRAAANEGVRQAEYGYVQNRFNMLTEVRQQFYTALAAQRRVLALQELLGISQESVRAAEGRVKAGEGTLTEVLLLTTEMQRAQSSVISAETVLAGELRQLAILMGVPDLPLHRVAGELTRGVPNFDEAWLREFVISQNAQVQIARRQVDRNQFLLQRARVEPYPNVRVGPAYSFYQIPNGPMGTQQFWFTLQFDIPTWNRNQGNIRSSEADVRDSLAALGITQNGLLRQVADALSRHRAARQRAERFEREILPNARRAQQLAREGFLKGVFDISTFLQAQRTLNETTVDYIDALEEVWNTAADLARLLQMEQFP